MKKLIVVICILSVMLGVGIAEIIVTNKIFTNLSASLEVVEQSMEQNDKHFDNPDTIAKIDDALTLWKTHRNYVFIVNNHTTMRNLDEKLITLQKQIEINADQDAPVTLAIVKNYVKELSQDNFPKSINIF